MNIIYIPVIYEPKNLKNFDKLIKILPKEIGIVYTVQFIKYGEIIKKELESKGFKVYIGKSPFIENPGQVLGCDPLAANVPTDTILYIGEGKFHPIEISRKLNKRVIRYSPISGEINEIKEDKKFFKKIEILKYKLVEAKSIGIITSIKPGQYLLKEMIKTKEILENNGKSVYLFVGDLININELNNFPYIDFWLIYACPRLIDDIIESGINGLTIDYARDAIRNLKNNN